MRSERHQLRSLVHVTMMVGSIAAVDAQSGLSLLGHLDYGVQDGTEVNSIWGYTDGAGREYALVGLKGNFTDFANSGGLSIVDVTDPQDPVEVYRLVGPYSDSYEAQTWGHYCYVTSRVGGGIRIIDLAPLSVGQEPTLTVVSDSLMNTAHTCFIDEQGHLYLNGGAANGAAIMFDLTGDPLNPSYIATIGDKYVHDCYARGDTLYLAWMYEGLVAMYDVSDPQQPVLLGTQSTPFLNTHNAWPNAAGDVLFTTDERPGAFVSVLDISDPADITEITRFRSDSLPGTVPHNTYWHNGLLYTSYYTYGVVVHDVERPHNPVEVGHYDTSPLTCCDFNGAWGVYPFLPSGNLVVSDIQEGLFVLGVDVQPACWLEGVVTNSETTSPVSQATLTISGTNAQDITGFDGVYATGAAIAGTYTVVVSAPGYVTQTVPGVVLQNGVLTLLNIALTPLPNIFMVGSVTDEGTGEGVAGAIVVLTGAEVSYALETEEDGTFEQPGMLIGTYALSVAAWGHLPICDSVVVVDAATVPLDIQLASGYFDDFDHDLHWSVTSSSDTGRWVRDEPIGTEIPGGASNPDGDVLNDCHGEAYITGNGLEFALLPISDFVRRSPTTLTSPPFHVQGMSDPHVRYVRWFSDLFGAIRDDTLHIALLHGPDTIPVETVVRATPGHATWRVNTVRILDHLTPTGPIQLYLSVVDAGQWNVVEAGLDRFEVLESGPVSMHDGRGHPMPWTIHPNPSQGAFQWQGPAEQGCRWALVDVLGKEIATGWMNGTRGEVNTANVPAGNYLLRITGKQAPPYVLRVCLF